MQFLEVGLVALVQERVTTYQYRMYPGVPAEGAPIPSITYQQIDKPGDTMLDGSSCSLQSLRMQFSFTSKYDTQGFEIVRTLANQFRCQVEGFSGLLPNYVQVNNIAYLDERYDHDAAPRLHRLLQDYTIWYYPDTEFQS